MTNDRANEITTRARKVVQEMNQEQAEKFLDAVLEEYNVNHHEFYKKHGEPLVLYQP